jgi:hypothetical protein
VCREHRQDDGLIVTTTNPRTGESWAKHLEPDDVAVIYGPELELVERRHVALSGATVITVRPRPGSRRG